jgi:hypothetical protein
MNADQARIEILEEIRTSHATHGTNTKIDWLDRTDLERWADWLTPEPEPARDTIMDAERRARGAAATDPTAAAVYYLALVLERRHR